MNTPWAEDPTDFQVARLALDDAKHLILAAISKADDGLLEDALSEAEAALDAVAEAIGAFHDARKQ